MSAFLRKLTPADRVIVVGDTKQHASLGAGRVFAELQEAGMKTFHLRKIIRQEHEWYRQVVKDLAKGEIQGALDRLMADDSYRIHELPDERLRHRAIAFWYLQDPLHTIAVTPDNRSAALISETIRAVRREREDLAGVSYRARILHSRSDLTAEDLRFAGSYQVGNIVEYARRSESVGLEAGDRVQVVDVNRDKNRLTVMRESDGCVFRYNPKRAGCSATVYEPGEREFAIGDRVQFTRAIKLQGISNRSLGTIEALDELGNVSVRIDGREELWRGNLDRMAHLDHGYVMTSYRVQSLTADRVMVHLDTDAPGVNRMLTRELAYVSLSRGRQDVQVFTNCQDELVAALSRSEEKPSALAPDQVRAYRREMAV
jgi:ATP-dependent exoDNAse (exonuclease V) alpha subunit